MEKSEQHDGRKKGFLLIVIGMFVIGIAIAILLTIYNQNLLEKRGQNSIIQEEIQE